MSITSRAGLCALATLVQLAACAELRSDAFLPRPADGGSLPNPAGQPADAGDSVDSPLPAKSACALLTARRCEYLQRCELISPTEAALHDCVALFTARWCGPQYWPARVAAGTLRYDAAKAVACADEFRSRACAQWADEPDSCRSFLAPSAYLTQACYGLYPECREGVCRGFCTPRRCLQPGQSGDICDEHSDCRADAGLYCRIMSTSNTGVGACTSYGAPGAGCDLETPCRPDLYCNVRGVCEARLAPGERCTPNSCVDSAFCALTPNGEVCALRHPIGEACSDDVQCQDGLLCQTETGRCESKGPVSDGGACSLRQSCAQGNLCVGATPGNLGACGRPLALGEPCAWSYDCEPHLACAGIDGGQKKGCAPRLPQGAGCTIGRDCQAFSICHNGLCERLPMPERPCLSGRCLFGTCDALPDGGAVCGDMGGPGDACLTDEECSSSRCLYGRCTPACAP